MPVWGMWHQEELWFSSSKPSRKAKNILANPRSVVATGDADNPVVVEGTARLITSPEELDLMLMLENTKYSTSYGIEMIDPALNASFRVRPIWAFGLQAGQF